VAGSSVQRSLAAAAAGVDQEAARIKALKTMVN
jgi:hypothetical protein